MHQKPRPAPKSRMSNRLVPPWLRWVILGGLLIQAARYYPFLPARVASHFDVRGRPNGWMARQEFLLFEVLAIGVIFGISFGGPALLGKVPSSMLNIPQRSYWLAPERRSQTLEFMRG